MTCGQRLAYSASRVACCPVVRFLPLPRRTCDACCARQMCRPVMSMWRLATQTAPLHDPMLYARVN